MPTYTTDTTITSNFPDGELLQLNGTNITVTIDASIFVPTMLYGNIYSVGTGTLKVINKTNNIIPIYTQLNTHNIRIESVGKMICDGDLIEIATGDGTAAQTIDFSSVGDNNISVNFPNAVWVEQTPGGARKPFINLGDSVADAYSLTLTGDGIGKDNYGGVAGDWERGAYFSYDRATQTATFGDGTNGHVIPNGCKVFLPNIIIDSDTWVNGLTSRSSIDTSSNGSLDFYGVQMSEGFYWTNTNGIDSRYNFCSFTDFLLVRDSLGEVSLKNIAARSATRGDRALGASVQFQIVDVQQGNLVLENIYASFWYNGGSSTSARGMWTIYPGDSSSIKNIHFHLVDKRNNSQTAVHTVGNLYYATNSVIEDVYMIGGAFNFAFLEGTTIKNITYGGSMFTPSAPNVDHGTKYGNIFLSVNSSDVKVVNGYLLPNSLPPKIGIKALGVFAKNLEFYNINYTYTDAIFNTKDAAVDVFSDDVTVKNCLIDSTGHNKAFEQNVDSINTIADNVRLSKSRSYLKRSALVNMISVQKAATNSNTPATNIGVFLGQDNINGSTDEGAICIQFSPPENNSYHYITSTGSYYNNAGALYISPLGFVEIGGKQSMRGFTGFRDDVYYENGSIEYNELTLGVEMVNGNEEFTGTYTSVDTSTNNWYAGLNTVFNSLTGYNSNIGLKIRFRFDSLLTNSNPISTINIPCSIDPNYIANDASITFEGGGATEKYEIIKASDDSVLYTFTGTGTYDFYVGPNFEIPVYFKRYIFVDGAYSLIVNTQYTSQKLVLGFNGSILLYTGSEVQTASTDPATIWNYTTRTTTEGFTSSDRDTLNKGLTTGKFLALK